MLAGVYFNVVQPAQQLARSAGSDEERAQHKARARRMMWLGVFQITGLTLAMAAAVVLGIGEL